MTVLRSAVLDDLLEVVREASGEPRVGFADPPTLLTGGFWAQLVSFRLAGAPPGWDGPLVARVMPDPAIAAKETAFQRAVAEQGYATPRVLAAGGPDPGIDGQAYLVMDLAAGQPVLAGLDGLRALRRLPSLARRLPVILAAALADLHRLDPAPVVRALDAAEVAHPTLPGMVDRLRDGADSLARADLVAATTWLAEHPPPGEDVVVCHGDLHPFNVLVDGRGATTVLDWSAAVLASPTYDLGFTSLLLAEPPLVAPGPLRGWVRGAGRTLSKRFVDSYEEAAGRGIDRDALAWQQGLICVRALVEVATWVEAGQIDHRRGHPWVIVGDAFASRLSDLTGTTVSAR